MEIKTKTVFAIPLSTKAFHTNHLPMLIISALFASQVVTQDALAQAGATPVPPAAPGATSPPTSGGATGRERGSQSPNNQSPAPNENTGEAAPDFGGCPYRERELEMLV